MARIRFPGTQESNLKLQKLAQGYLLEVDDLNQVNLYLKLDASVVESIFGGCQIQIIIDFDHGYPCFLIYIYDNIYTPLWIKDFTRNLDYNEFLIHFNRVINSFKVNININLSIYDLNTMPLDTFTVQTDFNTINWQSWTRKQFDKNNSDYSPFIINIKNIEVKPEDRIVSILNIIENDKLIHHDVIDYKNLKNNGRHGYAQENSLLAMLTQFFQINKNLFVSPKYEKNNKEYTDFLIIIEDLIVLIESKFSISTKPTNILAGLKKGTRQLFIAQKNIKQSVSIISSSGKSLNNELAHQKTVIRLCLYNSNIDISKHIEALKTYAHQNYYLLPAFANTIDVFQFLGLLKDENPENFELKLANNLKDMLATFDKRYKSVPVFRA